ncbi:nucleotidyltransferase family protein [Sphingomonas sp. BN140010]|uniref:Nucleotidyltransferase family protein n=1 Tax=Sphingomonas arvum TaxID=2992113 RepID=A0ABT3JDY3_9SPHN|nr:nucleotidyltransferase family protein [Sphingomonas sp. BN140010]MCW3797119.1 nucleotidyltransferase family protein [Sphingomonas sp. BN140010]
MTVPAGTLGLLASAFQGRLPAEAGWPAVLELANRSWLTPALLLAIEDRGLAAEVPAPVLDYLRLLHDCNLDRNRRLRRQLVEAVGALDRQQVTPILLKGCISLVESGEGRLGARMMSDIDLAIGATEPEAAVAALSALGYQLTGPRQLARSHDAGEIELHFAPHGRSAAYLRGDLRAQSDPVQLGGAKALVPRPTARALHLLVHDLIKEADFLRCRLDLRHLQDLAWLSRSEMVDWNHIAAIMNDPLAAAALDVQLLALRDLFGTTVALRRKPWRWARAWHRARLLAASGGVAGKLVGVGGKLAFGWFRVASGGIKLDARSPRRLVRGLLATTRGSRI